MVDTNALLSIAFSIIGSFTNVVHVLSGAAPDQLSDLSKCVIGSPHSPIDLYLVDRRGTEFTIAEGVVQSYYSAGSFFGLDDGRLSSQFAGELRLTSREAMT